MLSEKRNEAHASWVAQCFEELSDFLSGFTIKQAFFRPFDAFAIAVIQSDRHFQGTSCVTPTSITYEYTLICYYCFAVCQLNNGLNNYAIPGSADGQGVPDRPRYMPI